AIQNRTEPDIDLVDWIEEMTTRLDRAEDELRLVREYEADKAAQAKGDAGVNEFNRSFLEEHCGPEIDECAERSLSDATAAAYKKAMQRAIEWRAEGGQRELAPWSGEEIGFYLWLLSTDEQLSVSSLNQAVAAFSVYHRAKRWADPTTSPYVRGVLLKA